MKVNKFLAAALLMSFAGISAQAQLRSLGQSVKNAAAGKIQSAVNKAKSEAGNQASSAASTATPKVAQKSSADVNKGPIYYVCQETGSNRADGTSPATAKKDIQKVLDIIRDAGQNGAVVRVASGNYLGYLDAGYIEISNWITLEGGWNDDFTSRDPFTNITRIQPSKDQLGTNGSKALITVSKLDDTACKVLGTLIIDGIMLDYGFETLYHRYDPTDERTGSPEGVDTGRMVDDQNQVNHQCFHSDAAISGNVIIRNCLFANSPYFGIQFNTRAGEIEVYNNVIIANRYGGVRIAGWDKDGTHSHISFHHNTVAFSWCRDKEMIDMGYGFECMTKVNCDIYKNIFLCNNYAAISRTHALSGPDAPIEARRVTNVYDNYFFMNAADIQLPSKGGGKWTNVMVKQFEDIDEKAIPNIDGNKNLKADDPFVSLLWQPYLNGFANLKVLDSSSSVDANSPANLYRQAHGMNMQGTMIHRVSMFANRYRFDEAMKLFGGKAGYGAQKQ